MLAPFQKCIIGGSSGEGSKGGGGGGGSAPFFRKIYSNYMYVKIVENETVITFFLFWNPFLNCVIQALEKTKTKQNKKH